MRKMYVLLFLCVFLVGLSNIGIAQIPAPPVLVSPADAATNQPVNITLTWNASTGADDYRLQLAFDNAFTLLVTDLYTSETTRNLSGLTDNTSYYWRVAARNSEGESEFSTAFSFTTMQKPQVAPALVSPADASTIKALSTTTEWTAVTGAAGYNRQVSTSPTFATFVVNDSSATTSKALSGLANNTTYYWRVRAYNAGGEGDFSTAFSFSTRLDYVNVTTASGIQLGGDHGFAWADYDNDGDLDLFHSSAGRLYINRGNGTFALVSTSPDPLPGSPTYGGLLVDFTGDGRPDMLMGNSANLSLVINTGDTLSFIDTTAGMGLNLITIPAGNVTAATVADIDQDGNLEIAFAGQYGSGTQSPVRLVKLNTGTGQYENVASTVLNDVTKEFEAWNPTFVDVNNDGYMDLFMPSIRNGFPARRTGLYINQSGSAMNWSEMIIDGTPTNVSSITSVWGDIDNDGDMDLISQAAVDNTILYVLLNNGDGTFVNVQSTSGIVASNQMRGLSLGDYDNDGDLDLLIGGNNIEITIYQNQLVETSTLTFTNVTSSTVGSGQTWIRSLSFVDYDNDGKLDIFCSWSGTATRLFKNQIQNTNNWIGFRLSMVADNNRSAIGARVRVVAGGRSMVRYVSGGVDGCKTGGQIIPTFGLGAATQADSVIITWPDGIQEVAGVNLAANTYHNINNQGVVEVEKVKSLPSSFTLEQNYPNPFNPSTLIQYDLPVSSHVKLAIYDMLGREVARLVDGVQPANRYNVQWNASNLSSGVYFYRIDAKGQDGKNFTSVKKLILTK